MKITRMEDADDRTRGEYRGWQDKLSGVMRRQFVLPLFITMEQLHDDQAKLLEGKTADYLTTLLDKGVSVTVWEPVSRRLVIELSVEYVYTHSESDGAMRELCSALFRGMLNKLRETTTSDR